MREGKLETGQDDTGARQFVRFDDNSKKALLCGSKIHFRGRPGAYEANFSADGQQIRDAEIRYSTGGKEYLMDGDVIGIEE